MSSVLPDDILSEILIRLPVKSIGKSRCVSTLWNSLLTSPRFIKIHLARSHSHQKKLLMLRRYDSLYSFTLRPDGVAEGTFGNRNSIPTLDKDLILVGHCNGLVLMVADIFKGRASEFLLMNPTTLEHLRLPQPPSFSYDIYQMKVALGEHNYGLGYDSSIDDYKAVMLSVLCNDPEFCHLFADIYSFKKKCWKRVNIEYPPFMSKAGASGVFVNGALHWLCFMPKNTIVAFDLATEKCFEIPSLENRKHRSECMLTNKGSCLGIVCWDETDKASIEMWTMKEYGIAESWTKNVHVVVSAYALDKRPWFWRDALAIQYYYHLSFYCYNDDKSYSMRLESGYVDGDGKGHLNDVLIFTESLVSPLSL